MSGLRLEQRPGQTLVITPHLQQAIRMLQMSNPELNAWLDRELLQNPLLERAPPESPVEPPAAFGNGGERETARESGKHDPLDPPDFVPEPPDRPPGLREHIARQIALETADPRERMICSQLIDSLDNAGYFVGDLAAIGKHLGCPRGEVERALARLQACEPTGVGARSLRECLALQLAGRRLLDPAMQRLLDRLDLLARRDLAALAAHCRVDDDAVIARVKIIRSLDPKPGAGFGAGPVQTITPDIFAHPKQGGGWTVVLNSEALPRLLIDRHYEARIRQSARERAETIWIREKTRAANWLLRALDQRAETILKVAAELVRQQEAFLDNGVRHLRPLTLRVVASEISLHESTVSRAAANRFIATPRGIFELKYFFSAAIPAANCGGSLAAEAVRQRIRDLIDNESPSCVLSDDRLAALLRESGVEIARRTVSKYRKSLNILSSTERRREKFSRI